MTNAFESSAHRPTRWLAACGIGLGLGVGILTGTGVASADGSTITNIPSPPGPIPIPYPNIAAQTVQTSQLTRPWVQVSPAVKAALKNLQTTLTNSDANGLPGSTPGNSTGPLARFQTLSNVQKSFSDAQQAIVNNIKRDNTQSVKDAIKKAIQQVAEINRGIRVGN